ncbi:putative RuBisCO transcriptional regulator [Actinoplanes sp. SE50]|uniref:LysR family transcriptional regulator n=1 Tax=unclassified Actinoplanes TaxID=2626549 RepID=UPI00023EBF23|nr:MULTISPECIES: LysR family transcriptional regulator [unclassified Actinoplanes]AEV85122.1 putative RuBisCO transcriptional regulator [Actinoplanes sp. SE50/110]ATO83513.1 putative RuBisCO transcriptional regulator [Actinoplanes sp. SE50]SLM00920.1 LysR-family transcriptional regulator [Actinoplanes sp. SE50/110]
MTLEPTAKPAVAGGTLRPTSPHHTAAGQAPHTPGGLDLDDVAVFVQVVDCGGFTAAARVLRIPKSSVSRQVKRLEQRLGTQLLHRSTRAVSLTDAGRAFHRRVAAALAEVGDAVTAAVDAREVPRGVIRFTAPPDLGAEVLPALLTSFTAQHPLVRVDIDLLAHTPDLVEAGYDLALRVGRPSQHGLTTDKLQDMSFRLYASPGYLAGPTGIPATVEQLAEHSCILFRAHNGQARWQLHRHPHGDDGVDVTVSGRLTVNDMSFVRRAAVAGAGIALLPRLVGEYAVASGELIPVLPAYETAGFPLYLAYPSARHVPLAVRALRDHLLAAFPT